METLVRVYLPAVVRPSGICRPQIGQKARARARARRRPQEGWGVLLQGVGGLELRFWG